MIVLREHESRPRSDLSKQALRSLRQFDEELAARGKDTIFDWSREGRIRAKNYVGVLNAPGVQVEILPKIDEPESGARRNLLTMLSVARRLPVRERELASLRVQNAPILEALIRIFAKRLLEELRRGLHRAYVQREEDSGFVRGKIVLPIQIRRHAATRSRVFVRHEEFTVDTQINRFLKAACRVLLRQTTMLDVQRNLRESLLLFSDVADVV